MNDPTIQQIIDYISAQTIAEIAFVEVVLYGWVEREFVVPIPGESALEAHFNKL